MNQENTCHSSGKKTGGQDEFTVTESALRLKQMRIFEGKGIIVHGGKKDYKVPRMNWFSASLGQSQLQTQHA